jgi:hypothetical protein
MGLDLVHEADPETPGKGADCHCVLDPVPPSDGGMSFTQRQESSVPGVGAWTLVPGQINKSDRKSQD